MIILSFLFIANLNLRKRGKRISFRLSSLEKNIQKLEKENFRLKKQLSQAGEVDYIEKILREKGMYKLSGEGVIVVPQKKESKEGERENSFKKTSKVGSGFFGLLNKIKQFFKKYFNKLY